VVELPLVLELCLAAAPLLLLLVWIQGRS